MNAIPVDLLIRRDLPAARDGDHAAYGRIVGACQNTITAIALSIVRDVPTSEDIAQDAFLSAWQHLRRLQNPDSFLPWLRQITRNLARDHLRAKARAPHPVDDMDAAIQAAADPAPSPVHALIDAERQAAAADLISALPSESRETLLLFYREGQSSQQVATLLGLSDAAVRKRLSRARQALRDDLLARFGEFAHSSAPAAGFASIVTTALILASPPAAAGSVLGTTMGVAGAKTVGKLSLGAVGTMGLAFGAAAAAVWWELRRQLRGAIDDAERRALKRSAVISLVATAAYACVLWRSHEGGHAGGISLIVGTLVFMAVVFWQSAVVQPRAKARRHAFEARIDPVGAAKRRRRERWECWLGLAVGTIGGLGGLFVGLKTSGLL